MKTSLADSLSPKSLILLPSDPDFQPSLARWSELNHKTPGAIVKVGTEEDVPLLVRCSPITLHNVHEKSPTFSSAPANLLLPQVQYCLKHNIAFRATGGGHGIHSTIGAGGVIIDFSLLRAVVVDRRTMTMRAQAGALMQDALTALAAERCCTC